MEKSLILERLQMTIDNLTNLSESEYCNRADSGFITKLGKDKNTSCGDVVGWYAVWFPDAGIEMCGKGIRPVKAESVLTALCHYHGIKSYQIIIFLFYRKFLGSTISEDSISLQDTINRWIACKHCIEKELIQYR